MLNDYKIYATFLFALESKFPAIQKSQVSFFTTKYNTGIARGVIYFEDGIQLCFLEHLNFSLARITSYSYEVWQGGQQLYFYDPQKHPDDFTLSDTFPHHKHIPPDIKHHRVPAPEIRFDRPNLEFLLREIETSLLKDK